MQETAGGLVLFIANHKLGKNRMTEQQPQKQGQKTTHFGYETVAESEKAGRVADVFHSVASRYDVMNDLMSFGIHRLWKRRFVEMAAVRPGQVVLDIAGGTGDIVERIYPRLGDSGRIILSDINASMLQQARSRMIDNGILKNLEYVQANAEALPFADNYFDCITIAFGLRNVTNIDKALASMFRVLKPGGKLLVLEFSKPVLQPLKPLYDAYSFNILPKIGKFVANDEASYRYLAESIRMHPDQETLKQRMQEQGFERCDYTNLSGGIVAIHRGYKL